MRLRHTSIRVIHARSRKRALVPSELIAALSLVGTEACVRERIEAFRASGVTTLDVQPIGSDPIGDVRHVKEWIS